MNIKRIIAYAGYYAAAILLFYQLISYLNQYYKINTYKVSFTIDLIHLLLSIIIAGPVKLLFDYIKSKIDSYTKIN
jgi:hypothetical protein